MKKNDKPNKKLAKHLEEDIKGYKKQRQHLKKEIKEDKNLIQFLREKMSKRKKSSPKSLEPTPTPKAVRLKKEKASNLRKRSGASEVKKHKSSK